MTVLEGVKEGERVKPWEIVSNYFRLSVSERFKWLSKELEVNNFPFRSMCTAE